MEFCIIVCSSTLEEDVLQFFNKHGMGGYSVFSPVYGSGVGGGTRLGTEIWPGQNSTYFVAAEPVQIEALKNWASEYKKEPLREGLKIFHLAMKEMV